MRKKIDALGDWIEDGLRRMCGQLTPEKRLITILAMFLFFAGLSIYFTVSSIYRFGKGDGERIQIQQIEKLELELRQKENQLDSIKQLNDYYYEYKGESE